MRAGEEPSAFTALFGAWSVEAAARKEAPSLTLTLTLNLALTLPLTLGTGSISPLLVFCRRRRGAAVRRALVAHVQRARAKQLKGTSLDALARLLELDEA